MARLRRGPQPDDDDEDGFMWVNQMPMLTSLPSAADGEYGVFWILVLSAKHRVLRDVFPAVLFGPDAAYACAENLIHNEFLSAVDIVCVKARDSLAALAQVNKCIQELNDRLDYKFEEVVELKEAKRNFNRAGVEYE